MRSPAAKRVQVESGPALYRASVRLGLSAIGHAGTALTLILIGLSGGGCSLSRPETAFAKMEDAEITGTISPPPEREPTEADLAFARNAASDVLTKGTKDSSQPWQNPQTGARGSVTPIAQSYTAENGRTCRDFLASYVNGKTERWLQGSACRIERGRWDIHTLKPWQQS
ncbi:surface antigen [Bradyrhizobium sp. USDA 4353]